MRIALFGTALLLFLALTGAPAHAGPALSAWSHATAASSAAETVGYRRRYYRRQAHPGRYAYPAPPSPYLLYQRYGYYWYPRVPGYPYYAPYSWPHYPPY